MDTPEHIGYKGQGVIPVYIKLRISVDDEVWNPNQSSAQGQYKLHVSKMKSMISFLRENKFIHSKMTCGFEVKGKTGDYVRPHYHIHFDTTTKKDTIRKSITRHWEKNYDEKLSGNKMWSLQIEPYVVEDKFFCYALKQQDEACPTPSMGFDEQQVKSMIKAAQMTAAIATEVAQKKQAKKEEADTLYDRLAKYLDQREGTLGDIVKFYMDENRPINKVTIRGYYDLYRLKTGRMTIDEYVETI